MKNKNNSKKVQLSLSAELVNRVDEYNDENYLNRSTFFTLAATQYLNAVAVTGAVRDLSLAMRKIADTGNIDADTLKQLEDFERLAKMICNAK